MTSEARVNDVVVGVFKYSVVKVNHDEYTFTDLLEAFSASTFSEAAEIAYESIKLSYSNTRHEGTCNKYADRYTVSVAGEYFEIREITPLTGVTHL